MRRLTGTIQIATALCAFALAMAVPADAYLRDLQTLDTGVATSTLDRKTVESRCPPAGPHSVPERCCARSRERRSRRGSPCRAYSRGGAITADEADEHTGIWTLAGQTQCALVNAARPALLADSGPYFKNVRLVHSPLPYSRTLRREAGVDCPADAAVPIGGGFFFHGHVGQAHYSGRLAAGRSLRVGGRFVAEAHSTDPFPPPVEWALSVTAICADVSSPARPGQSYVTAVSPHTAASPVNSDTSKTARAECPAGKIVVGGGAFVEGPTPSGNPPFSVVLRSSLPAAPTGRPQGWYASGVEEDPESIGWRVVAKAICVTPAAV